MRSAELSLLAGILYSILIPVHPFHLCSSVFPYLSISITIP